MTKELFCICERYKFSNNMIDFLIDLEDKYSFILNGNMLKDIQDSINESSECYGLNEKERFIFELGIVSANISFLIEKFEMVFNRCESLINQNNSGNVLYKNGNENKCNKYNDNIVDFAKEVVRRNIISEDF